jgi:hypothetical protein
MGFFKIGALQLGKLHSCSTAEVFGIFYFWRRSRLPCRTGNSSEREPYILGASEPKTWEEEQAAI